MKKILVTKYTALVDDEDYQNLSLIKWYPHHQETRIYAISKQGYMHPLCWHEEKTWAGGGTALPMSRTKLSAFRVTAESCQHPFTELVAELLDTDEILSRSKYELEVHR
jgi:hypothetical protein